MANHVNRVAQYFESTGSGAASVLRALLSRDDCDVVLAEAVADGFAREFTDAAIDFTSSDHDDGAPCDELNSDSPPVVRLLDLLLVELQLLNASKILITPVHEMASVWFEVDGELIERDRLSLEVARALATRIEAGVAKTPALARVDARIVATKSGPEILLTPANPPPITPVDHSAQ
jgi:hypothetical protein